MHFFERFLFSSHLIHLCIPISLLGVLPPFTSSTFHWTDFYSSTGFISIVMVSRKLPVVCNVIRSYKSLLFIFAEFIGVCSFLWNYLLIIYLPHWTTSSLGTETISVMRVIVLITVPDPYLILSSYLLNQWRGYFLFWFLTHAKEKRVNFSIPQVSIYIQICKTWACEGMHQNNFTPWSKKIFNLDSIQPRISLEIKVLFFLGPLRELSFLLIIMPLLWSIGSSTMEKGSDCSVHGDELH